MKDTFKQPLPRRQRHLQLPRLKQAAKSKKWLRSKTNSRDSARCFLLGLPTELVLEISSHLTDESEACLALTCKRLYAISGASLSSPSLRFQRDFPRLFHHYRDSDSFGTARWRLLTLLEDRKWRACSKCLKIHPRSAFSTLQSRRKPTNRTCKLGDLAGIVDLCPCKKLTFQDRTGLVALLQARKDCRDRYCWHSCVEKYGSTELQITIFPHLDKKDNLVIRTEYRLSTGRDQLACREHLTARLGCPHRSADLWFSSVVRQTSMCREPSECLMCRSTMTCSCCVSALKYPTADQPCRSEDSSRITYFFYTQRPLGVATWPRNASTRRILWSIDMPTMSCVHGRSVSILVIGGHHR